MFESFYGNEPEQYVYYSVPKLLFTDDKFKKISTDSKLLYSFLLDRAGLSVKNNWIDEDGKVYVYFRMEELCDRLNIGKDKAVKVFNELDTKKGGIGLISRKKQGQGKPTKIYVNNFTKYVSKKDETSDFGKTEVKTSEKPKSEPQPNETEVLTSENQKSGVLKIRSLDFGKTEVSLYSNPNKNNLSISTLSINQDKGQSADVRTQDNDKIDGYNLQIEMQRIFDAIGKELVEDKNNDYDLKQLDELIQLMAWVNLTPVKEIRIGGVNLATSYIREQLSRITSQHLKYVLDSLKENKKQIKNRKNYLLTCLYNAPSTMDAYYKSNPEKEKKHTYDLTAVEKAAMSFYEIEGGNNQ